MKTNTPRQVDQPNGKPGPWHILGTAAEIVDDRFAADPNGYILHNDRKPAVDHLVYPHELRPATREAVPAYVLAEVDRQYAADHLRTILAEAPLDDPATAWRAGLRTYSDQSRLWIDTQYTPNGSRRVRVFVVARYPGNNGNARLENITGNVATVCGYQVADIAGGRRSIVVGGHGFCAAQHVAEALAFYLFGDGDALTYSEM